MSPTLRLHRREGAVTSGATVATPRGFALGVGGVPFGTSSGYMQMSHSFDHSLRQLARCDNEQAVARGRSDFRSDSSSTSVCRGCLSIVAEAAERDWRKVSAGSTTDGDCVTHSHSTASSHGGVSGWLPSFVRQSSGPSDGSRLGVRLPVN